MADSRNAPAGPVGQTIRCAGQSGGAWLAGKRPVPAAFRSSSFGL